MTISNASPSGSYTVTVTATDNCGATSSATFLLTVSGPQITGLIPSTVCQNSDPSPVTITGLRFTADTLVLWNGVARAATFVDAERLRVMPSFEDLTSPRQIAVRVADPSGTAFPGTAVFTVLADQTPPVVMAPEPIAIVESLVKELGGTGEHGATSLTSLELAEFLSLARATDECSPADSLGVRFSDGRAVTGEAIFPPGISTVEFLFADRTGNIGAGGSMVTVYRLGSLIEPSSAPGLADYLLLMNVLAGNAFLGSARYPAPAAAADVNRDGTIDRDDLRAFEGYLVGGTEPRRRRPVIRERPYNALYPIRIDPAGMIGAFRATIRFDPARVSAASVVAAGSVFSLRSTPLSIANQAGKLIIIGAITGTVGPSGPLEVATIRFAEFAAGGVASVRTESLEITPPLAP